MIEGSRAVEAAKLRELVARIEASRDPRLEMHRAISGSRWPRIDALDALHWALDGGADDLVDLYPALRACEPHIEGERTSVTKGLASLSKDDRKDFNPKSAGALFTVFLGLCYRWGYKHDEDIDAVLKHIRSQLEGPNDDLPHFQQAVVAEALLLSDERVGNIMKNARTLFSKKTRVAKEEAKLMEQFGQAPKS